jgi:hypothetical protein
MPGSVNIDINHLQANQKARLSNRKKYNQRHPKEREM